MDTDMHGPHALRQTVLLIGIAVSFVLGMAASYWFLAPSHDAVTRLATQGLTESKTDGPLAQQYTQRLETILARRVEHILEPILGSQAVRAQVTADIEVTVIPQTNGTGVSGAAPISSNKITDTIYGSQDLLINGRIHRLSIAVLIDDKVSVGEKGQTARIRYSPEELERITELAKKAAGFDEGRGDSITVMNASFMKTSSSDPITEVSYPEQSPNQEMIKHGLLAIIIVALIFVVLGPVIRTLTNPVASLNRNDRADSGKPGSNENQDTPEQADATSGGGPAGYEEVRHKASLAVEQDPKLVAQVVKKWVAADGRK